MRAERIGAWAIGCALTTFVLATAFFGSAVLAGLWVVIFLDVVGR